MEEEEDQRGGEWRSPSFDFQNYGQRTNMEEDEDQRGGEWRSPPFDFQNYGQRTNMEEDEYQSGGALRSPPFNFQNHDQHTNMEEEKDQRGGALRSPPFNMRTNMEKKEEESVDALRPPPINSSREERIAWFKHMLPSFRVLESTPRTRLFHKRVQYFLLGEEDRRHQIQTTKCRVSFFMTWISPATKFGPREFLCLESVLKSHPNGCVVLVSRSMDSNIGQKLLAPLLNRGFKIFPVAPDFSLIFSNTPAQAWLDGLKAGNIDPGRVPITQNLSNLLRLVLIYKYGGVYLDLDVIILKDISSLKNSIGAQSGNTQRKDWEILNNAVLIFDKGHPLVLEFIKEFASHFDGNVWGYNGPLLATRVARRVANDSRFEFSVFSPMAFYPVDWTKIGGLFLKPKEKPMEMWANDVLHQINNECYGIHLWNALSHHLIIEEGSIMGRLISDHCIICQHIYNLTEKVSN